MLNIVLLGAPGSGKGTQTKRLVQKYGFIPIALGALLRKQIEENNTDKDLIERYINNGKLIPHSLTFKLVTQLVQAELPNQSLLFDGFPRTSLQATFLDNMLTQCNTKIDGVIFLDVSYETLLQRLKGRAIIEKRTDDQDSNKIKARMEIYEQETLAVVNYYKAQGKLHRVDGAQAVDQVEKIIEGIIDLLKS